MMRSLFSGVAGLKSHQTRMDVIGNNIANVNTTGFKAGRLTFQDMMSQSLQGASGANGTQGGTNPMQVGLGVGVSSIDNIFTDGNVQSTGVPTDLCISGDGFFALTDGSQQYYTRAGDFKFDDAGNYVSPSGMKVLGWMADANNNINNSGTPTALYKPTTPMPAKATSLLTFTGTLNSNTANGGAVTTSTDVYDSLGNTHTLTSAYYKVNQDTTTAASTQYGTNTWYCLNKVTGATTNSLQNEYSKLQFNTDGTVKSITTITPSDSLTNLGAVVTATAINGLKLSTDTATSPQYMSFAQVDDVGAMHVFQMKLSYNSSSNTWDYSVYEPTNTATGATALSTGTVSASGTTYTGLPSSILYKDSAGTTQTVNITYTGSVAPDATAMSGYASESMTNATVQTTESPLKFSAVGAAPVSVSMDRTKVTQANVTSSAVSPALNNGYKMGTLTNVSFNTSGQMIGTFSNNQTKTLGQVAMANFANPGGLTKAGDTMYLESNNSGIAQIGASGTGGRGVITPSSLEMSNVDLAEQFSDMIITQRGFQANSKIITTTDDMLEELANLKR